MEITRRRIEKIGKILVQKVRFIFVIAYSLFLICLNFFPIRFGFNVMAEELNEPVIHFLVRVGGEGGVKRKNWPNCNEKPYRLSIKFSESLK